MQRIVCSNNESDEVECGLKIRNGSSQANNALQSFSKVMLLSSSQLPEQSLPQIVNIE